ncbi:MAG: Hpt domain-containing protein [Methylotenera sp.]|nr:Hpt domain-containing protein [Oligoflexia bacterium]
MKAELAQARVTLGSDFAELFVDVLADVNSFIESIEVTLSQKPEWDNQSLEVILAKLHSLKGLTGQFGLVTVSKCIHKVEDAFAVFRKQNRMPDNELIAPLIKFNDALRLYAEAVESEDDSMSQRLETISELASLKTVPSISSQAAAPGKNQEVTSTKEMKNYILNQEQFELIFENLQLLLETIRSQNGGEILTRNIETSLFAISSARFLKIAPIVKRIEAMVGDISRKVGKEIHFQIDGTQTLIDRMIYTTLGEILIHILKNSIDHGIEDPADRMNSGKTAHGNILVTFESHDDKTRIIISDDGKGIDPDIIAQKALEKKVITEQQMKRMTTYEKQFLIFEASFSTKEEVSEMSGRGVGMDAVIKEVRKNGGTILLDSIPKAGTKFIIDYPCAFQMRNTVIWRQGDVHYCMPTTSIEQILLGEQLFEEDAGMMRVLKTGQEYPLLDLKLSPSRSDKPQLIICQIGGIEFSLKVDEVIKVDQLFLKPITYQNQQKNIITALGELGDSSPVYYINVAELETNLNQYMNSEESSLPEVNMSNVIDLSALKTTALSKEQIIAHLNDVTFISHLKGIMEPLKDKPTVVKEIVAYISEHLDSMEKTLEEVEDLEEINYGVTIKYAYLKSEWIMLNIRIQYLSMADKPIEEAIPYKAAACSALVEHFEKIISKDAFKQITKVLSEPFNNAA